MRKLKLQAQITVDGFIAAPDGRMDMSAWNWGDDIKQYVERLTQSADTIVLGRSPPERRLGKLGAHFPKRLAELV